MNPVLAWWRWCIVLTRTSLSGRPSRIVAVAVTVLLLVAVFTSTRAESTSTFEKGQPTLARNAESRREEAGRLGVEKEEVKDCTPSDGAGADEEHSPFTRRGALLDCANSGGEAEPVSTPGTPAHAPECFEQNNGRDYYYRSQENCPSASVFQYAERRGGAGTVQACSLFQCDWYTSRFVFILLLVWFLVAAAIALSTRAMYKILKSYSKKAERKHEVSRGSSSVASTEVSVNGGGRQQIGMELDTGHGRYGNGAMVPAYGEDPGELALTYIQGGGGGAYSETSSFESHEHYERRLQRVKRSRGDRDRAAATRRSTERGIDRRALKVSEITREEESGLTAKDALMQWARRVTEGYPGVHVRDMTGSWRDGLAFNAILHKYRPDLINWREVRSRMNTRQRLDHAFSLAEREFGVTRLLDPEDVEVPAPDEKSMMTYISTLYDALPDRPASEKYDRDVNEYRLAVREFLHWVHRTTRTMQDRSLPTHAAELKQLLNELERFKSNELPPRLREKQHLEQIYLELENLFGDTAFMRAIEEELTAVGLNRSWNQLTAAISEREQLIMERMDLQGNAQDIARRLNRDIGVTNEKLDVILVRIEETEARMRVTSPAQLKEVFDGIVFDLNLLEAPIEGYFRDVESLKGARHPQANESYRQVFGLHQRRLAYLERCGVTVGADGKYTARTDFYVSESYFYSRDTLFKTVEESIEWIERKLKELSEMQFVEDLKILEETMEKHKMEHRDIMDFRHRVDQCIANQAKIAAADSGEYCDSLHTLEEAYAQLRELSTGRVLDLDSLIAFIRAAQMELMWINEREELEVSRNWSDVNQLDLPMLQNYYKQLMHEIELREEQFNAVHNQGAALINQGHPAIYVIEAYLTTMQAQWDWLLSLTQCLEIHLQDAVNMQQFVDDAQKCELWMEQQMQLISTHYDRGDFSLDEGERLLRELEEIREMLDRYHEILLSLIERSRIISPLWQRGERIHRQLPVNALCNYQERNIVIRKNDECILVDNSDMIKWMVRTPEGVEGVVPSVVFRIPPPDERLLSFLQRLQAQFDRLRRLWTEKQRTVRFTMILNTMRTIRSWDLKQFMALEPDQREAIIKALNDDTNKLLAEMDPNDPLALRLRDELRLTNEHFYKLLQAAQRGPEPELADKFDEKIMIMLQKLEDAWRTLNDRVAQPLPRDIDIWEKEIVEHKTFEDSLQALDSDVSMVQELFRQLEEPSPMQRARMDQLAGRWEDLWELSRMYAERLKALEVVLNGLAEASQIVSEHEITLASFNTMPAKVDELRGVHSQLLEIQLILQQQQPIMDDLATNVGQLRQHVVRTRCNVPDHPDVDQLEDEVQRVTVRWENICMQVIERLKSTEMSLQSLMIYRAAYESEVTWLDRVEATLRQLRTPEDLKPDEYQEQLDILLAEYAHLNERTQAMENVNLEGGKYIRDARVYDVRLTQYKDLLEEVHKGIDSLIRRTSPPPTPGADVVSKELDDVNKRFAQLSSIIYQRQNDLQLLMQKYKQKQLEEEEKIKAEERKRRAEEERKFELERQRLLLEMEEKERLEEERRRRKALEDLEKERQREERERELQRLRELEAEKERLRLEDAQRRLRERERAAEDERLRREQEELRKRDLENLDRRRREEAERLKREREEAERRRREEEERLRLEEEKRRLEALERQKRDDEERRRLEEERLRLELEAKKRREEDEMRRRQREKEDEERRQRELERDRERERWEREQRERELLERTRVDIPLVKETFVSHKHISPPPKPVTVVVAEPKQPEVHLHFHREEQWREGLPGEIVMPFDEAKPSVEDVKVKEHEDETDVIMYAEETEQRTKFYELEAIKHMQTGEILTFVEAVRQGLLDLRSGEFFDITSGSRISLVEAVGRGYISQSFNDCLQTRYGIRDPNTGEELSLFEAIQRGLYDPECRQLRDPATGELMALYEASRMGVISMDNVHRLIKMGILKLPPLHLEQAIEQKVVDLETGQFVGRFSKETLALREALHNGYISITSPLTPMIAVTLTDCIEQRFIEPNKGEFVDKNTQEKFTLREAVSKQNNLINLNVREVVNTADRKRVTVGDAILRNIVNTRQGNFTDMAQRQELTLLQAYEQQFIQKPLTLKTVAEKDLIDSLGHFIDGGTKKRMTLLESVAEGLLDPDSPHIVDPVEADTISLAEALERGIVTPRGFFSAPESGEEYPIQEANKRGLLVEPVKFTVFDVKGVKNTKTNQLMSFNEAVEAGAVQLSSERFIDLESNESYMLPDTVEKGRLLDPMLHMILSAVAGIKDQQGNEMSVFKAIAGGVIDTKQGAFVHKDTNQRLQPKEAYERGLISLKGAMQLTALFNVHPSLVVVNKAPKVQRKRIQVPGAGQKRPLAEGETRMSLGEALSQGLLDARAQRFRHGDREITLQEALNQGLVDNSAEWIVPAKGLSGGPTVQESVTEQMTETSQVLAPKVQPTGQTEETVTTVKRVRTKETVAAGGAGGVAVYRAITSGRGSLEVPGEGLHVFAAERDGLFDMNTGVLTVPDSDRTLTLEEALELGILNLKQFTVTDAKTGQKLSINDAIEKGVMDKTGHIRDHKTGRTLSLQAAIDADHVTVTPEQPSRVAPATKVIQFGAGQTVGPVMSITPIGTSLMEESEMAFSFDSKTGDIVDGFTGQRISLDEAVHSGKISRDILRVKDALTEREMSYVDAIKWGIIDKQADRYSNKRDGTMCSLREAAAQGLVFVSGGITEYSKDSVRTDIRQQTRKVVTTKEAAIAGPAAFVDYSLQKVIELGWYDEKNGLFTHPDTKKQMSLKDAIMKGLFNPYESMVINLKTGEQMSLLDAIQSGTIDPVNGTILDESSGERMDLKAACDRGLIRSGVAAQTLQAAISSGRLDLSTGEVKLSDTSGPVPLHEAISRGIIEPNSMIVKDHTTGEQMAFLEAVRTKTVDLSHGLVINKRTGDGVSLTQAIQSGIIQPVSRPGAAPFEAPLAVAPIPYAPKSPMKAGISPGSKERLVDLGDKQAMVKVIKDEHGIEKGEYVDSATGMKFTVRLHGDPYATQMKTTVKSTAQVQSIELVPHAEMVGIDRVRDNRTGREMTLADAQRMGLATVSKHGKQLTKTYAVFRSDLTNALKRGVIDPGTNENISLPDAIKSRLIDIQDLVYVHPQTNDRIDFVQAANMGLLDVTLAEVLPKGVCNPVNGERISISRAIELRVIDPKSGAVFNPFKNETLTWLDILKPVYASLTMEGIYDPRKGYAVPIPNAINDGLIDVRRREYHNPITNERYSLEEASKVGLIDEGTHKAITTKTVHDWQSSRQVDLLEAVQAGIVNPQHRTVHLAKGVVVPVSKAMEEGKFPQDVGQRMRRVDKLTFAEALGRGLIDVRSNQYIDPDTGKRMTVSQALQEGYIDTSSVESQEGVDERNLCNVIDSYEFDENSGRIREQKTGLYLTFREATERGVIDGDSLLCDVDSGRTMTLRSAMNVGLINNDGKYVDKKTGAKLNLRDAVRVGSLALISSPMLASQAFAEAIKRREKEGFKFKIEKPTTPTDVSPGGGRVIQEEISTFRVSTPRQEPTLSLKVRTEEVSDRLRSLISDPQAYADRQHDFIRRLGNKNVDVTEKVLENPASGSRISIKEAVETGLLDVVTGEVVHPTTGRRYSVPKAVHMKYIQPSAAKSVMEALNLNLEQLYSAMQGLSPRSDFSPVSFGSPVSGGSSGPNTSVYTRDVVWRGDPAELRSLGGDLSQYTTVSGTKTSVGGEDGHGAFEERTVRTTEERESIHQLDDGAPVVTRRVEETIRRFGGPQSVSEETGATEVVEPESQQQQQQQHNTETDEIGEKYAACGDSIDGLLGKIRKSREDLVDRLYGHGDTVDGPSTVPDLTSTVDVVKEKDEYHRNLEDEVKASLKLADQLSNTEGATVLSPEEFHNLRKRSGELKLEYENDSLRLQKMTNRLTVASKLKEQLDAQTVAFRAWLDQTNQTLDQLLSSVVDSSQISSSRKRSREISDDVSGHRSELDAITSLARQIQDELKGCASQLPDSNASTSDLPALTAIKNDSDAFVQSWQALRERCQLSHHQLEDAKNFFILYGQLKSWLTAKSKLVAVMELVGTDPHVISSQLQQIQVLLDEFESQKSNLDDFLRCGASLKSAQTAPESQASVDEKITEIREKWDQLVNDLNAKKAMLNNEIDLAKLRQQQSDLKGQDMLNGLLSWLTEQEDAIGISPSADPKVLKAQIEAQKLLQKLISDKYPVIIGFKESVEGMSQRVSPEEREILTNQASHISERYDKLVKGAEERHAKLHSALELAEQWAEHYPPLLSWLDNTERTLQKDYVSIDADRLAAQIDDHKTLHEEIEGHRGSFDNIVELGAQLSEMVADDEREQLNQQLVDLTSRYDLLGSKSLQVEEDLVKVGTGLEEFMIRMDHLDGWLNDMHGKLASIDSFSAVPDTLQKQAEEIMALGEKINDQQKVVTAVMEEGRELCRHARGDEAVTLQGKLDGLRWRYSELNKAVDSKLGTVQEIMPLAERFDNANGMLSSWLAEVETDLAYIDDATLDEKHALIENIDRDLKEFRPWLADLTTSGARLAQVCPGDETELMEGTVSRTQKRFENVEEQVRKKGEQLSRLMENRGEVIANMDDLIDWFQKAEMQIQEAGAAPAQPAIARKQLQEQKLLHSDVGSQRARGREAITAAKKLLKDMIGEEAQAVEDKMEVLKESSDGVHQLSSDRLSVLEQAVPLAEHFDSTHADLSKWLDVIENELESVPSVVSGLHPEQLRKHTDYNKAVQESIQENKPLLDGLNKTGAALSQLCNTDDANFINDILDQTNARFEAVREQARARGHALNDALQQSLEVSDQLDNMLDSLAVTADKVRHPEPVAGHPDRIREQLQDNSALMDELEQKHDAYKNVQASASDILGKADPADPAVSEIKGKMNTLNSLWNEILSATELRGRKLDDTLVVAQRFWDELLSCEQALKNLQQRLDNAEPPACEPEAVEAQKVNLAEVEAALHQQAPKIDACRDTGKQLLEMVGDPEIAELQHHIDGLNSAWDTVTSAFHRRHEDLLEAMEKAMNFHEMLRDVTEYLSNAEQRFSTLEPISSNLLELQEQIEQISQFKSDLDQQSVVMQQLNQQCDQLVEGRTSEQATAIKRPMQELSRRFDQLAMGVRQRRDKLDEAYVKAGHFQQALDQVLDWIEKTDKTLDDIKPLPGDLKQIEIEIAKHKVLQNDVHSRQTSIDTLNEAGRKLLAAHEASDPKGMQLKLDSLNRAWATLLEKLAAKGAELEACKGEAAQFGDQVQHWLHWLADVEDFLSASKAVGGLPETTREQLENFMVIYDELQSNKPKVEETIRLGEEYAAKSPENASSTLAQHVKTLKQRWDASQIKANDRKTKLEIAYADALDFDELMKQFVDWLMNAEQYLNGRPPVSRLMEEIQSQMTEHTEFRDEVNAERAVALELNAKGTKLKYYCQKQDVILIKNLLVSTGNRWDKVVSRTGDRTKQLEHAYNDVREFYALYNELGDWCEERSKQLEEAKAPGRTNKAEIIKENLNIHKEFQQELGNRQRDYDTAMKLGKQLKDHAPKSEQPAIQDMLNSLREKWNSLCNRSIDRQRELEEDLLFAGQFKDTVDGLLKWLAEVEPSLSSDIRVYGDIDTVTGLVDQHRNFMSQLKAREATVETVRKAGEELLRTAENPEIESQLKELNEKWAHMKSLAADKENRLQDAKTVAEKFYHGSHAILEWLSEMETKVKYAGAIPDDEEQLNKQLQQLGALQEELKAQKTQLDDNLQLGNDILTKCHPDATQPMKQWLTILQARWDEVASWAQEREGRLKEQLNALRDQDELLDDLLRWLAEKEAYLRDLETDPIPQDLPLVENLIEEHAHFEDTLRSRQPDFDEATKGRRRQEPEQAVRGKDTKSKKPRRTIDRGRNPKVQQVTEKFNNVWLMSLDRKRKLDEMLNYLRELRKMQDFNFDDWRRRYTAWMNNKKSRVMDFFRRQDKDGDGKVTRQEFIDGILQSKFPTTRMEMNAVADIFDKDGDGYIDYREFINALRPERDATEPKTDSQRIKSEVQKQAQMCTCRKKYEILEIGEGKYRFGEQLRLVRILRSTVMVRVGGGWVALDEFLVKNDPCRAKGRTNVELREKFILADGVSQTMLPFKSKNPRGATAGSHASSSSDSSMASPYGPRHGHDHDHSLPYHSTPGPIMKVREKTERSMPMSRGLRSSPHQNGNGASSADSEVSGILSNSRRSSADLLSPDSTGAMGPRSATGRLNGAGSSRPSSRPGSRGGSNIPAPVQTPSRPPSRAGSDISDVSLRSHDSLSAVTPTRIPSARKKAHHK